MAVLPDSLHHHQRRIKRDLTEDIHAAFLAVDEAMLFDRIKRMPSAHLTALGADGGHHDLFSPGLRRPALLIGRESQITIGYNIHSFEHIDILPCAIVKN